jgi:hypothetical protein
MKLFIIIYSFLISVFILSSKELNNKCYYDFSIKRYELENGKYILKHYDLKSKNFISSYPQYDSIGDFYDGLAVVKIKNKNGFIDKSGIIIDQPIYDELDNFSEGGLALIKINNKYGFIDKTRKIVIQPQFDYILQANIYAEFYKQYEQNYNNKINFVNLKYDYLGNFSEELARFEIINKFGFINKSGKIVIEPQFDYVSSFKNGYAIFKKIDDYFFYKSIKYGKIDKSGNITLIKDFQADDIGFFSDDLSLIEYKSKIGFCDSVGTILVSPQYDAIENLYMGLAKFKMNNKFGYTDSSGNVIIQAIYDDIEVISEGLIKVKKNNKYGFINKTGEIITQPVYDFLEQYSDSLAKVQINSKFGFIDKSGKIVIQPKFDDISNFTDGIAVLKKNNQYGFIDKSGNIVVQPQYDYISNFSEGLTIFKLNNKSGFMDTSGRIVVKPYYDSIGGLHEGLATVKQGNKYGYIDKTGKIIVKPQFNNANEFSDGVAIVEIDGKWGILKKPECVK